MLLIQQLVEIGLKNIFSGWPPTGIVSMSTSQVPEVTSISHHAQPLASFLTARLAENLFLLILNTSSNKCHKTTLLTQKIKYYQFYCATMGEIFNIIEPCIP
jgi:hypothetical protein